MAKSSPVVDRSPQTPAKPNKSPFKQKESPVHKEPGADDAQKLTTSADLARGSTKFKRRPPRKRKISVSHFVLERKRRNSVRTTAVPQNEIVKTRGDKFVRKKYLGRSCKRQYGTLGGQTNESPAQTSKRTKLALNTKNIDAQTSANDYPNARTSKKAKIDAKKTDVANENSKKTEETIGLSADKKWREKSKTVNAPPKNVPDGADSCKTSRTIEESVSVSKSSAGHIRQKSDNTSKPAKTEETVSSTSKSSPVSMRQKSDHTPKARTMEEPVSVSKSNPDSLRQKPEIEFSEESKTRVSQRPETLLDKEFPDDSSDEEYKPDEDELNELDDTLSKSLTQDVDWEEPGKCTDEVQQSDPVYMTRSKVSYTDKALEDIEQAFIPPDIDMDMYDCVIDDQDWKEFLTEFTKPIDKINTNEDDDTEFIPNLLEEELIDSEEFRRDPGVKVSKKELNELMGELFDFNEIYDYGNGNGKDDGNENIDDNINDYVNLKFNETIQDSATKKDTPKKVAFVDANEGKGSVSKKHMDSGGCGGKGKKKITPDKSRQKSQLSEELNKQIMDEINKEINKYIQINETYVYKGDQGGNSAENYDNYEEYIVIIGNSEPTAQEINKLAQVKMATTEELVKENEGVTDAKENVCNQEKVENNHNQQNKVVKEPDQQLSIKLVQKTMLTSKTSKVNKKEKKVEVKPAKPPKDKAALMNDLNYNYGKITQKQNKDIYEAYLGAIEMYKAKYGVTSDEELAYHSNIIGYAYPLYQKECERAGLVSTPVIQQTVICNETVKVVNDVGKNIENKIKRSQDIPETSKALSTNTKTTHIPSKIEMTELDKPSKTSNISLTIPQLMKSTSQNNINNTNLTAQTTQNVDTNVHGVPKTENIESNTHRTAKTTETLGNNHGAANNTFPQPTLHLFDEEDLKLLQQQINQHIQYSLQHYLQTYNHPRLAPSSTEAKRMITTFHEISRRKPNSYFASLNVEEAMRVVNDWEAMHQNVAFKKHMDQEWSRCVAEWRSYANTLALPKPVINVILNSPAFIYPVLLPCKSFEPRPRKLVNPFETTCELTLLILGFLNYAYMLSSDSKFERHKRLHDVLTAVQRNFLPAHSVKHLSKKLWDLIHSPRPNVVQNFFRQGELEECRHFIIDHTRETVVAPGRQSLPLLPAAWQDCVRESRRGRRSV